jgi:DNA recombination protein RmuC
MNNIEIIIGLLLLFLVFALIWAYQNQKKEYYMLEKDYAILHTRFEESIRGYEEKLVLLDSAKNDLKLEFANLANNIFQKNTQSFDLAHKEGLHLLLEPFREQIGEFALQSREQFLHDAKDRQGLKDELIRLKTLNERLSKDAIDLTNALKGDNKIQGNWGEIVLERILIESGLREGHEYYTQHHLQGNGKSYKPDVVINLPRNREIIIDSKVSLLAYDEFMKADTNEQKQNRLKAHISSINTHIRGLSAKRYERLENIKTVDFVLLFIPIEGAFHLALEHDSSFFSKAFEQNIVIVSPSTLLVTMRTIEHIWRTEKQEQNAKDIATHAEALYDKFVSFVEDMEKIGERISQTQVSYDSAISRLSSGRGNLIKRVENMRELGLKPKKTLKYENSLDNNMPKDPLL